MTDGECVAFLQWALPRLRLRWRGFRRVRRQVCRRVTRRIAALALEGPAGYRDRLEADPAEWSALDALCRIPISRFHRDRRVFEALGEAVLPELAAAALGRRERELRAWSAGCASGEEPYTLAILWRFGPSSRFADLRLSILATDADETLLGRARDARYLASSLRELPEDWREAAFLPESGGTFRLRPELRGGVRFRCEDLRRRMPDGPFDLVLCRNLAFTYFDEELERETAARLAARVVPGGALVVGASEALPEGVGGWTRHQACRAIYRRIPE